MVSRVWLFTSPWTKAHQAPLSMEFFRQEYWNGLPFPPPGDLAYPGNAICIGRQILCLWDTCKAPMAGQYWWGEEKVLFCSLRNQLIRDLPLCNCINGNARVSGTSWQRERQLYDNVLGSYILWTYSQSFQGLSISSSHILPSNCKDFGKMWESR